MGVRRFNNRHRIHSTMSSLPGATPSRPLVQRVVKSVTTKEGLIGTYDYKALFTPNIPFIRRRVVSSPFFGLHDRMPLLLSTLLGFQHALAMLAGVITPPLILSGQGGANLELRQQQYLVSTALIVSGILSAVQITRFHIWGTPYYIGTGLLSVVGVSFTVIPIGQGALPQGLWRPPRHLCRLCASRDRTLVHPAQAPPQDVSAHRHRTDCHAHWCQAHPVRLQELDGRQWPLRFRVHRHRLLRQVPQH